MEYIQLEWTEDKIKRFWDFESRNHEKYFAFQAGKILVRRLKKYLKKGHSVLDYGSGPGFLIKHLLNKNLKVSALEFSVESINKLNAKYSGILGFEGSYSIEELSATDKKFDVITLIEVIEHLDDKYLELTFKNIRKYLKPGGILIITTPNDEDLWKSFVYCPDSDRVFHKYQHVRSWNTISLRKYVEEAGLEILKIEETNFGKNLVGRSIKSFNQKIKRWLPGEWKTIKPPHLYCISTFK